MASSTRTSAENASGDGAEPSQPLNTVPSLDAAREAGLPVYLVPEDTACACLRSWGLACLYVPETLTAIEPSAVAGTHAVALPGKGLTSRRWADLVAADLLDAGVTAKVARSRANARLVAGNDYPGTA